MVNRCRVNTQAPTFAPTAAPTTENIDPNWQRRLEMNQGNSVPRLKGKVTKVFHEMDPSAKNDNDFNADALFL